MIRHVKRWLVNAHIRYWLCDRKYYNPILYGGRFCTSSSEGDGRDAFLASSRNRIILWIVGNCIMYVLFTRRLCNLNLKPINMAIWCKTSRAREK